MNKICSGKKLSSFEKELIELNEEEIFGRLEKIEIEESEVIRNMKELINLIKETMEILIKKGTILYKDAEDIRKMIMIIFQDYGDILAVVEKYM